MKVLDTEFIIDKQINDGKLQCTVTCKIIFDPYSVQSQVWQDNRQEATVYLIEKAIRSQKSLIPYTAIGKAVYKQGDNMDERMAMKIAESKAKRNMYKQAANIAENVLTSCESIIESIMHKDYLALSILEDIHIKELQNLPLDTWDNKMKPILINNLRNK